MSSERSNFPYSFWRDVHMHPALFLVLPYIAVEIMAQNPISYIARGILSAKPRRIKMKLLAKKRLSSLAQRNSQFKLEKQLVSGFGSAAESRYGSNRLFLGRVTGSAYGALPFLSPFPFIVCAQAYEVHTYRWRPPASRIALCSGAEAMNVFGVSAVQHKSVPTATKFSC